MFKKHDGTYDNIPKSTCLWLKNLPLLIPDTTTKPEIEYFEWTDKRTGKKKRQDMWSYKALYNKQDRQKNRSKTFEGIAKAFAEQWG